MRAVIQRVSHASCTVEGTITGQIEAGFLVLLGIEDADTSDDAVWLAQKIANMRVFSDEHVHQKTPAYWRFSGLTKRHHQRYRHLQCPAIPKSRLQFAR